MFISLITVLWVSMLFIHEYGRQKYYQGAYDAAHLIHYDSTWDDDILHPPKRRPRHASTYRLYHMHQLRFK